MTQLKSARAGKITPQMELVAQSENLSVRYLRDMIKKGHVVIPANKLRPATRQICGIGQGLRTKVNANIGTSPDYATLEEELRKLRAAEEAGADTVMDLSTGGDLIKIRQTLLKNTRLTFGTVPIYEAVCLNVKLLHKTIKEVDKKTIFQVIEKQAQDGVDFMTIHAGITRKLLDDLKRYKRVGGVVSRGGAILIEWMKTHKQENPFYEDFDRLLEIAREYDLTLSLGDGLRPGAVADAGDRLQIIELKLLSQLAQRARSRDVQVIIEGPGHMPINQIVPHVRLQKKLSRGVPFYLLGPLVTDIAPGYDHITSAIGGALAATAGADFLCYVTPREHLGLPTSDDVREGVIASRIAAHAADIAKGIKSAWEQDKQFSKYRRQRNWAKQIELSLDPKRASSYRQQRMSASKRVCSMCGKFCVYTILTDF